MAAFIDLTPIAVNNNNGAANLLVRTQNVSMINHIRPANASEVLAFPTAVSAVICNTLQYNQPATVNVLTAQTVSALKALIAA